MTNPYPKTILDVYSGLEKPCREYLAYESGKVDLIKRFNEWATERIGDYENILIFKEEQKQRLNARIEELQNAKYNLARLAKDESE